MKRNTPAGRRIEALLDEAEAAQRCARAMESADVRVFRRRVREGALVEPAPQLFARAAGWEALDRGQRALHIIRGLAAAHPDWVFCSFSAALVHGLSVSFHLLDRVHIVTPERAPVQSTELVRRHSHTPKSIMNVDGVRVTPVMETLTDCLLETSFSDSLALADSALRKLGLGRTVLERTVEELEWHRYGVNRARDAALWADPRSESGGESIARAFMIEAALAPSDLQVCFEDPTEPGSIYRADCIWRLIDGGLVIGEVDGIQKYWKPEYLHGRDAIDVFAAERQRESRLSMLGIPVVRFRMEDVYTPGRIEHLLAGAGVRPYTLAPGDYRDKTPSTGIPIPPSRFPWEIDH